MSVSPCSAHWATWAQASSREAMGVASLWITALSMRIRRLALLKRRSPAVMPAWASSSYRWAKELAKTLS